MKKSIKSYFLLFAIFAIIFSTEVFAGWVGPNGETNLSDAMRNNSGSDRLEFHYERDSSGNKNNGSSNDGGSSGGRMTGGTTSGGPGGGGGGGGLGGVGNSEPNRFVGPEKNMMLRTYNPEDGYTITTIREGKNAGNLRVRDKRDKILYGFYKIKSSYNSDVNTYFFDFEAKIHIGFVADTMGDIYYFTSDGTMLTGNRKIGNLEYEFTENGALKEEYIELLKQTKENVYCVDYGIWQQNAESKKWRLLDKDYFGQNINLCINEVKLCYDKEKNKINAYVFDENGYLVEEDTYIQEGVLYVVSKEEATLGAVEKVEVPDIKLLMNEQLYSSDIQVANLLAKY